MQIRTLTADCQPRVYEIDKSITSSAVRSLTNRIASLLDERAVDYSFRNSLFLGQRKLFIQNISPFRIG